MWVDRDPREEFDLIDSATLRFIKLKERAVLIGLREIGQDLDQEERFKLQAGGSYKIIEINTTFRTHVIKWNGEGITPKVTFQIDHPTGIRFVTRNGDVKIKFPR